jgi:hypothetical protein
MDQELITQIEEDSWQTRVAYSDLVKSLTNHTPGDIQLTFIELIREHAKTLGAGIIVSQGSSRERSLALTKLEECIMWAVKGIVLNEGKDIDS